MSSFLIVKIIVNGAGFLVRGGEGATIYGRLVNMYPIE